MHQLIKRRYLAIIAAVVALAGTAGAQASAPARTSPELGSLAPDFSLPAATRYGVLRDSITLSSFRGKTVVLAFFY